MTYAHWGRILVHAFLGEDPGPLAEAEAMVELSRRRGEVVAVRDRCRAREQPWPVSPPESLSADLPWAHYAARVAQLRVDLELDSAGVVVQPAARPGLRDREVERLRGDRPPHWG